MGLSVALEDERGGSLEVIHDPQNLLHRLLPGSDKTYGCLRYVDLYGGTVFDYLRMDDLLTDLQRSVASSETLEDRQLVGAISRLALRCRDERHLYLKFYGD